MSYSPDQPRDPPGSATGGQWTGGAGGSPSSRMAAARDAQAAGKDLQGRLGAPDSGFTYNVVTGEYRSSGYAVSPYPERTSVMPSANLTEQQFVDYMVNNADLLAQQDHYFGGWNDPATGLVHLDVSIVVGSADQAASIAREKKQISYFDFQAGKSVPV